MSKSTTADAPDPTDENRGVDWLERNSNYLYLESAKEQGSESWERAKENVNDLDVEPQSADDVFRLELPDGEPHLALMVKSADRDHVGACTCNGWAMHRSPCAHLCALAQADVLGDHVRTQDMRAKTLASDGGSVDADVVEHGRDQEDVDEPDQDDAGGDDHADDTPRTAEPVDDDPETAVEPPESDAEDGTVDGSIVRDSGSSAIDTGGDDPFAGALPDVPEQYVMTMDGQQYIRRAGYARMARAANLRLELSEVVGAHETDWSRSKYRATVIDENGETVASDVGTAHAEYEDMDGAEANLDELASTRAATRALAWATGEGLTAVAEVAESKAESTK